MIQIERMFEEGNDDENKDIFILNNLKKPSFLTIKQLWHKTHDLPEPDKSCQIHKITFFKIGRTFGFETTRFLEFQGGVLYYYEGEHDLTYKGYCKLDNVYMHYARLKNCNLLHLTNGIEYTQLFFRDDSFESRIPQSFYPFVIQTNFNEKYLLLDLVGRGSFSFVYTAEQLKTGRKVAVKTVAKNDEHGSTKVIIEEEKKNLTKLNSDHICKLLQFYEEDEEYLFIFEYLEGMNLHRLLHDKFKFSMDSIMTILKSILEGLIYIHSHHVIHRDIKPQNIIINLKTFEAKLIDFGLSLTISKNTLKKAYKRCGTVGYMAHEVITSSSEKRNSYNHKCDMFSFGIVAHMLLMGRNPLKGQNYEETCKKNILCSIRLDEEQINKKYGEKCYQFLSQLLSKDPEQRWSAKEAYECDFLSQKFDNSLLIAHSHHTEDEEINPKERGSFEEDLESKYLFAKEKMRKVTF